MSNRPSVAVIIPTLALAQRADLIRRALQSVLSQEGVRPQPIVVVNGSGRDPSLVCELRAIKRVKLIEVQEPGIPGALHAGHAAVESQWFSTLDDDDILLPGALSMRIDNLSKFPSCDTIVTNGFRHSAGKLVSHIKDIALVEHDPLHALTGGNWLLPGSWLCRSNSIDPEFFQGMPTYRENTYLAIQFSLRGRLRFLQEPTVVWHMDTPGSETKTREYLLGIPSATERLLELPLPAQSRHWLRRSLMEATHHAAVLQMREGAYADAWRSHLRSLTISSGWRYLPFSLWFFWATIRGIGT